MYEMMNPLAWRLLAQHHQEILREVKQDRLARVSRANRNKRRCGTLARQLERVAGRLLKTLRDFRNAPAKEGKEAI